MTSELQVFSYKGAAVRTVDVNDEPYFVGKDVADVLGYKNPQEAVREHVENEDRGVSEILTPGGKQNMTVINESGLYSLILASKLPSAKEFKHWVTSEVLPSIRRTGSYRVQGEPASLPSGVLEGARMIFDAAGLKDNQLSLALDKVYASYTGRSALQTGNVTLKAPTQNQLLTPTQIGEQFRLSARQVNEKLAYAGYQHKIAGRWEPIGDGKKYGVMLDVGKRYRGGTPVRQLKWDSGILSVFSQLP